MGKNGNSDFILLGSKITADGGCNHEVKIHLLLGRKAMTNVDYVLKSKNITLLTKFCKAMTNLDNVLKGRDITLPTKVHLVKATVFPIVMYGCESWTIKKAEH